MDYENELVREESTYIYIGRFDLAGFPIVTSRQFHHHASVTLQAISLVALMAQTIRSEPVGQILIRHDSGLTVCVEPNVDGYIAYLKQDCGGFET
jgi:hypothetical protein